jgi:hypothetical protein
MMRVAAMLFVLGAVPALAHDVITTKITWSREISRLVYRRCVSCHAEFVNYEDARPWAKAMKEETGARRMPPWQAVKGFGDFKDDRGLTQEEIELISDWVEGGSPEGDPRYLPEKPKAVVWMDPSVPAGSASIVVAAGFRLKAAARVVAVRPEKLAEGSGVQVIATRPDGTAEPLVWIYGYNPKFRRTYYYRSPVALPAGTVFEMGAGTFTLFTRRR